MQPADHRCNRHQQCRDQRQCREGFTQGWEPAHAVILDPSWQEPLSLCEVAIGPASTSTGLRRIALRCVAGRVCGELPVARLSHLPGQVPAQDLRGIAQTAIALVRFPIPAISVHSRLRAGFESKAIFNRARLIPIAGVKPVSIHTGYAGLCGLTMFGRRPLRVVQKCRCPEALPRAHVRRQRVVFARTRKGRSGAGTQVRSVWAWPRLPAICPGNASGAEAGSCGNACWAWFCGFNATDGGYGWTRTTDPVIMSDVL